METLVKSELTFRMKLNNVLTTIRFHKMVEISEVPEKSDSRVTEAYLEPITLMIEFFAKKKSQRNPITDRVLNTPLLKDRSF